MDHTDRTLDELRRTATDPERLVLLTGATVVTMDPALGTVAGGDILVRGDRIVDVGRGLPADGALVVDVGGSIVAPGMVDTHRHAWQAQMRRTIPDVDDLLGYLRSTLMSVAPAYTPDDVYLGTRLAALTALDSGITTMLDFAHNSRSAAHSDAAICPASSIWLRFLAVNLVLVDLAGGSRSVGACRALRVAGCG